MPDSGAKRPRVLRTEIIGAGAGRRRDCPPVGRPRSEPEDGDAESTAGVAQAGPHLDVRVGHGQRLLVVLQPEHDAVVARAEDVADHEVTLDGRLALLVRARSRSCFPSWCRRPIPIRPWGSRTPGSRRRRRRAPPSATTREGAMLIVGCARSVIFGRASASFASLSSFWRAAAVSVAASARHGTPAHAKRRRMFMTLRSSVDRLASRILASRRGRRQAASAIIGGCLPRPPARRSPAPATALDRLDDRPAHPSLVRRRRAPASTPALGPRDRRRAGAGAGLVGVRRPPFRSVSDPDPGGPRVAARRLMLVGAGPGGQLRNGPGAQHRDRPPGLAARQRRAAPRRARAAARARRTRPGTSTYEDMAQAAAEGLTLAEFDAATYKTSDRPVVEHAGVDAGGARRCPPIG